ncbi:MAG: cupin domain-containing protein [Gammaproteobacteria bacterium]|nr:cupin domain-containing protein [Gammaproteobacteria bacterium]
MKKKQMLIAIIAGCGLTATIVSGDNAYNNTVKALPLLTTSVDSLGQPIHYPQVAQPGVTMLRVQLPPGSETGWHMHPVPGFAYVISGTLTVEYEGGKQLQFSAGQGFAEVVNALHNGKNPGSEPVTLVVVFMGEKDKPFAIKAPK